jgi:hypothetical protein
LHWVTKSPVPCDRFIAAYLAGLLGGIAIRCHPWFTVVRADACWSRSSKAASRRTLLTGSGSLLANPKRRRMKWIMGKACLRITSQPIECHVASPCCCSSPLMRRPVAPGPPTVPFIVSPPNVVDCRPRQAPLCSSSRKRRCFLVATPAPGIVEGTFGNSYLLRVCGSLGARHQRATRMVMSA